MAEKHSDSRATIRPVGEADVHVVRGLYIAMLTDTPYAFGETIGEVESRTDMDWKPLATQLAKGDRAVAFIAEDAEGPCGFVRADTIDPRIPSGTVLVGNLWTAPRQRGQGLGRALMDSVEHWATEHQAQRLALGVTDENHAALRFYSNLGYRDTGRRAPAGVDPNRTASVLAKMVSP
jgi:ribosomal protein S18 acetylase RimI-like enzyme